MPTEPTSHRRRSILDWARAAVLVLAAWAIAGCEGDRPPDTYREVVAIKDVPDDVLRAAKKALPGVRFEDAWKNLNTANRSLHSYEVRGRNARGKIREVRVATDGAVLEME